MHTIFRSVLIGAIIGGLPCAWASTGNLPDGAVAHLKWAIEDGGLYAHPGLELDDLRALVAAALDGSLTPEGQLTLEKTVREGVAQPLPRSNLQTREYLARVALYHVTGNWDLISGGLRRMGFEHDPQRQHGLLSRMLMTLRHFPTSQELVRDLVRVADAFQSCDPTAGVERPALEEDMPPILPLIIINLRDHGEDPMARKKLTELAFAPCCRTWYTRMLLAHTLAEHHADPECREALEHLLFELRTAERSAATFLDTVDEQERAEIDGRVNERVDHVMNAMQDSWFHASKREE